MDVFEKLTAWETVFFFWRGRGSNRGAGVCLRQETRIWRGQIFFLRRKLRLDNFGVVEQERRQISAKKLSLTLFSLSLSLTHTPKLYIYFPFSQSLSVSRCPSLSLSFSQTFCLPLFYFSYDAVFIILSFSTSCSHFLPFVFSLSLRVSLCL